MRHVKPFILAAVLSSAAVFATGIPVFDAGNFSQTDRTPHSYKNYR